MPLNYNLSDQLKDFTKANLLEFTKLFGFQIPTSLGKDKYAARYAACILEHPELWLSRLPKSEVLMLQEIANNGADKATTFPASYVPTIIESLQFVTTEELNEFINRFYLPDDLAEILSPAINALMHCDEQIRYWEIEQTIIGLCNLYGSLSYAELKEHLNRLYGAQLKPTEISKIVKSSVYVSQYLMKGNIATLRGTTKLQSIYLSTSTDELIEAIEDEIKASKLEPKQFSHSDILKAGLSPLTTFSNKFTLDVCKSLKKHFAYSDKKIQALLHFFCVSIQFEETPSDLIADLFLNGVDSSLLPDQVITSILEYSNSTPYWVLRGHSPNEADSDDETDAETDAEPTPTANRNDPCPCGSGKKYKHCCGLKN